MAIEPQHKIVTDSNTQLISLVFGLPIAGLAPYANVVLLIPSPDLGESVAILRQRNTLIINGMEANRFLITHPSNRELAKIVVYTKGQTPIETKDEILKRLELKD